MAVNNRSKEYLMRAIRRMHSLVESPDVEKVRASQENISGLFTSKGLEYEEIRIGEIAAEWVRTGTETRNDYVILYCHGGGYNTGSFRYARSVTNKLAETTNMNVLSFDYRLAPEFPYPCALEDAMSVWHYLLDLGCSAEHIMIAGDSAGGNLALSLALKLKELGKRLPRGLVLFSPWTDLTLEGYSHKERAEMDPILTEEYLENAVEDYAGQANVNSPFVSPLFGNFRGFPPVFIQVGSHEILLADSEELYTRMEAYQVDVKYELYEGMWHVFQMSPFKTALEAMERVGEFISQLCP